MKTLFTLIIAAMSLCSCASVEEAYHTDRDFGKASQRVWQQQLVYPEAKFTKTPEGVDGIIAEETMDVYSGTFAKEPQQSNVITLAPVGSE